MSSGVKVEMQVDNVQLGIFVIMKRRIYMDELEQVALD